MKRGPKPVATPILKLRGSWRAKHRPDYDAGLKPERPVCPKWLSPPAKKAWRVIVPNLAGLEILQKVDVTILSMFCETFAEWQQAQRDVTELKNLFIKQPSGRICKHPLIAIRDESHERLRKLIAELGLSPSARTQLHISKKQEPSPAAKFFEGA